jgi:hypothetical protein
MYVVCCSRDRGRRGCKILDASHLLIDELLIFSSILPCLPSHIVLSISNIFLMINLAVFFPSQQSSQENVHVLTKSLHMNESKIQTQRTEFCITNASIITLYIYIVSWLRQVIGQQGTGNFYADRKRAVLSREPNHGCLQRSTSFVISRQPTSSTFSQTLYAHTPSLTCERSPTLDACIRAYTPTLQSWLLESGVRHILDLCASDYDCALSTQAI